jgi:hypothetical protein
MVQQELSLNKMKLISLLSLLFLYCSCKENKASSLDEMPITPPVFTMASSPHLSFRNDTAFLNSNMYSGCIYALDSLTNDSISVSCYSKGLLHGLSRKWYPGKQLMEERYYVSGKKNGRQLSLWENGNKRFEFIARDDAYEGELKEWNIDGRLIHLAHFENGQEAGAQKLWYDNGKIRANYVILNGKRYGLLGTKNCRNVSDCIFAVK